MKDYAQLCDSVSLCFSKGLGAPAGSVLVGKKEFLEHARWIRKSIGGGLRQTGVLTSAMRVALDETFGSGPHGEGGKLKATHALAKRIAKTWTDKGGKLELEVETNMVWLDLGDAGVSVADFVDLGKKEGLKLLMGRLVVHYQIGEEAVARLERVMDQALSNKGKEDGNVKAENKVGEKTYGTH